MAAQTGITDRVRQRRHTIVNSPDQGDFATATAAQKNPTIVSPKSHAHRLELANAEQGVGTTEFQEIMHPGHGHPDDRPGQAPCACNARNLQRDFTLRPANQLRFHTLFHVCSVCQRRPADRLCLKTWRAFCFEHARENYNTNRENYLYANYDLSKYEECFWCMKCKAYPVHDFLDSVLEPLWESKGSFMNEPVKDLHSEYIEGPRMKVATCTCQGWRSANEDAHIAVLSLPHHPTYSFFGVFDGHGGPRVSRFAGQRLARIFDEEILPRMEADIPAALQRSFIRLDEIIQQEMSIEETGTCGSTVNVVVVTPDAIFCANAGDSRAIMLRDGQMVPLSKDHKPEDPRERARIQGAGSIISADNRIEGMLAVSRAVGDFDFKQAAVIPERQAVTCDPDVKRFDLTAGVELIVLACDGIWDCVESAESLQLIKRSLEDSASLTKAAESLCKRCVCDVIDEEGLGTDNTSLVVVQFKR